MKQYSVLGFQAVIANLILTRFEYPLLAHIHKLGEKSYSAELRRQMSLALKKDVSFGQLSRSLKRLSEQGYLIFKDVRPEETGRGSRRRRVYSLSPSGIEILERSIAAYDAAKSVKGNETQGALGVMG